MKKLLVILITTILATSSLNARTILAKYEENGRVSKRSQELDEKETLEFVKKNDLHFVQIKIQGGNGWMWVYQEDGVIKTNNKEIQKAILKKYLATKVEE